MCHAELEVWISWNHSNLGSRAKIQRFAGSGKMYAGGQPKRFGWLFKGHNGAAATYFSRCVRRFVSAPRGFAVPAGFPE
jgi:hypothetical protein